MNATCCETYTPRSLKGSEKTLFVFPRVDDVERASWVTHEAGVLADTEVVFLVGRDSYPALVYADENEAGAAARELTLAGFRFEVWSGR